MEWITAIDEMLDLVGREISSNDDSHTWAALTHFFVSHLAGTDGDTHLQNIGVARHSSALSRVCESFRHAEKAPPHKTTWPKPRHSFTFIDLFAGIGGFHIAMAASGGRPVFVSEWDDSARITYARNFGIVPYGDLRFFTQTEDSKPRSLREMRKTIPKCDVVSAGFPCQPFSLAGVSSRNFHGLAHGLGCATQGTLFEDVIQVARASNARAVLLENVKNLASHDDGRTLPIIFRRLRESGFEIFPEAPLDGRVPASWAVQDSSLVSAQRRKRIYFVAIRRDSAAKPFKFPELKAQPGAPMTIGEVLRSDSSLSEAKKFELYGISAQLWQSHQKRDKAHSQRGNGFRSGLISDRSGKSPTLVARYYKDGKDCLIPRRNDPTATYRPPRMLTPRECAILQTFPDGFLLPAAKTPAYKQLGNSITIEVARQICASLAKYMA